MLVPDIEMVVQLLLVMLVSLRAETMLEPGTVRSGLMRPSAVGPQLLNEAIESALVPRRVAPTATALFAVAGLPPEPVPGPALPAAKKIRSSLWFHMNSSTSWLAAVYLFCTAAFSLSPQELVWMRAPGV